MSGTSGRLVCVLFLIAMVSFGETALQLWDFSKHLFPKSGFLREILMHDIVDQTFI